MTTTKKTQLDKLFSYIPEVTPGEKLLDQREIWQLIQPVISKNPKLSRTFTAQILNEKGYRTVFGRSFHCANISLAILRCGGDHLRSMKFHNRAARGSRQEALEAPVADHQQLDLFSSSEREQTLEFARLVMQSKLSADLKIRLLQGLIG